MPISHFQHGIQGSPMIGANLWDIFAGMSEANVAQDGNVFFVDGDLGSDGNTGKSPNDATLTIQAAVNKAAAGATIYIRNKKTTALSTDPASYAETITISNSTPNVKLIGVPTGRVQGGLPQIKKGSGSTALITVKAPGCLIANLGINGSGSTGGGVLLDDDGGSTKVAFGTTITDCHFKNCVGSNANDASTGGAVQLSGAPWQIRIANNRFFNNVGDVVVTSASNDDAKDVVIEHNEFGGPAAAVDCYIYMIGSGADATGLLIRDNSFAVLPALSAGAHKRFMKLTGYSGLIAHNFFGTSTLNTFAAAGSMAYVPTTMFLAGNWGEGTALITRS
jgi:hypothetical protein